MIVDNINNADSYVFTNNDIAEALNYIRSLDVKDINLGKHEVKENRIYAIFSEYDTNLESAIPWEAHLKYIDIQYILEGEECIGYTNINRLRNTVEYNSNDDVIFGTGKGSFVNMYLGDFMILFPQDAHKPGIVLNDCSRVKKLIMKVRID